MNADGEAAAGAGPQGHRDAEASAKEPELDEPRIFIYDNYPGGIGFSEPLYRMHHELLDATRRLISGCECENGCPGCVGPLGDIGPMGKSAALRILDLLAAAATGDAAVGTPAMVSAPADSAVPAPAGSGVSAPAGSADVEVQPF